jgi:hypothetical protein
MVTDRARNSSVAVSRRVVRLAKATGCNDTQDFHPQVFDHLPYGVRGRNYKFARRDQYRQSLSVLPCSFNRAPYPMTNTPSAGTKRREPCSLPETRFMHRTIERCSPAQRIPVLWSLSMVHSSGISVKYDCIPNRLDEPISSKPWACHGHKHPGIIRLTLSRKSSVQYFRGSLPLLLYCVDLSMHGVLYRAGELLALQRDEVPKI